MRLVVVAFGLLAAAFAAAPVEALAWLAGGALLSVIVLALVGVRIGGDR